MKIHSRAGIASQLWLNHCLIWILSQSADCTPCHTISDSAFWMCLGSNGWWPKYLGSCDPRGRPRYFLAPDFSMAQPWLLWAPGERTSRWKISLCLWVCLLPLWKDNILSNSCIAWDFSCQAGALSLRIAFTPNPTSCWCILYKSVMTAQYLIPVTHVGDPDWVPGQLWSLLPFGKWTREWKIHLALSPLCLFLPQPFYHSSFQINA